MVGISNPVELGGYMEKSVYDADGDDLVEAIDTGAIIASNIAKSVSDTLRHSSDAIVTETLTTWSIQKTFTFTNGIKGTLRMKFQHQGNTTNATARIMKNNGATLLGAEKTAASAGAYGLQAQDIDVGTIEPGGTIELWGRKYSSNTLLKEFRIYYDSDVAVAVT